MSFQFNPRTFKFVYKDRVVGSWHVENGQGRIHLDICYDVDAEAAEIIEILALVGMGLKEHAEKDPPKGEPLVTIETDTNDVYPVAGARRTLVEVTIKRDNYQWRFHLSDADPWPSIVHGHDYDRGLKLDAFTGKIYDVGTKAHCETLKKKKLSYIVAKLKEHPEFKLRLETDA